MTRFQSENFGYGLLRAENGSVARFEQRANDDDRVLDSFVVRRHRGSSPRVFGS